MRIRVAHACGALLMAGLVMSACGSDDGASSDTDAAPAVTDAPVTSGAPVATDAPVSGDDPVTTDAPTTDGSAPAETEGLCASIPDPAAIEAAIGEAVKEPLDSGDPGYAQGCTLLRAADDFPGITFNFTPDRSIDDQYRVRLDELRHRHRAPRGRRGLLRRRGQLGVLRPRRRPLPDGRHHQRRRSPDRGRQHDDGMARPVDPNQA